MAIKKFKVNASKQAKSIKKRIIASELLSGIDKLPERGKVITKTIKGDPVVIVGIGDNKYMYKSYLNKASATGDVQFIRNLIKKGEVPANAVKNLGYKLYTSSGSVESACGKKSVKASSSLKVKPYVINKGQSGEYYGLKNAEDNQVLRSAPNNWKSEKGAINWAKKKGYDVVDSACGKKSVKAAATLVRENDMEIVLRDDDGAELRVVKHPTVHGYRLRRTLNSGDGNKFQWDLSKEIYDTAEEAKQAALEGKATFHFKGREAIPPKPVQSSTNSKTTKKQFGVKASKTAKKRKAIKASGIQDDIVMYFNGDNVYQGSVYDLADAVENLCYDDEVNAKFQEWCNQFGDPFDFDGSPIDTARVFANIIIHEAEESPVSEDGQSEFYEDGDGILDFEIFYADEFSIDGAKKSIKCSAPIWPESEYKTHDVYEVTDPNGDVEESFDSYEEAESYAKSIISDTGVAYYDIYHVVYKYNPEYDEWDDGEEDKWVGKVTASAKKSVKCTQGDFTYDFSEDEFPFRVTLYYDHSQRGIADGASFDNMDEAVDYAHEKLAEGPVRIEHYDVGAVDINPDEYWENFDGEFWCTPELAEWRDEVWKSMGIGASKSIKCGMSLNLNAKPNYTDWVLRGYKFDGEDVTTLRIDFQDDVKKAVMDMFSDPDIETVDLYKIPTEQETTGVFEDEEYFSTFTRDDINASTDITAALNKKSDINDEQYNQALADEVADMLRADGFEDIEVSVAPEAISFFINDEVMFVQPTNMITPNMADIYDDCTELFNAVKEAATDKMWKLYDEENKAMRDAWEDSDIDDPDYATRAVTLSRKAKGKDISAAEETIDIDDLDYISGDDEQEDLGYGFDSNGDPIDESTVEELNRIAQEIVDKSEIAKYDRYADVHNFDFYMSSPYVNEKFDLTFTPEFTSEQMSANKFINLSKSVQDIIAYYKLYINIRVKSGEVADISINDVDCYVNNNRLALVNIDEVAIKDWVGKLVAPVANEIYYTTANI